MKKPGSTHISKNVGPKQKKRDTQSSSTLTLAAGLSNLMEDLTNAEELENSRLGESSSSIRYWTDLNWELVIRHIPRTCNLLADKLSAWGRLNSQEVVTLPSPPSSMVVDVETAKSSMQIDPLVLQDWFGRADAVCFNPQVDPGG
ncbi:hypothetical protein V6N13_065313 [Hibiscus sabdariffa]|uniref:RNase H type-1 domain-containing protein n=1 Tax=Hibiscus sabdariffa TaxID=183260 RepID=A0ABR2QR89_9ROSI